MNRKLSIVLATAALATMFAVATASATVEPISCGTTTISGKRYEMKVDQITCSTGKPYIRTYLKSRRHPRGYTCHRFTGSAQVFKCEKGSIARKTYKAFLANRCSAKPQPLACRR